MTDTFQEIKEDMFSKDNVTHILALVIVIGAMGLYIKHLWWATDADLIAVDAIGKYLGGTIAIVLGYYFGSAIGEKQAKTAENDKNLAKVTMVNEIDELKTKLDTRLKEIKELTTELENL
jgi:hypothetical protein